MIELDQEQRMVLSTVRNIAREKVKPKAAEIDEKEEFPWETATTFAQNGILTPLLPEEFGGIGSSYLLFSMIIEEIARVCASSALILIAQADGMLPILHSGTGELKKKYLPGLSKGLFAAFAATEPGAGSDILYMRSKASSKGGFYVLNGQKCFITNGSIADILTVFCYTDPSKGARGMSAFVVEKGFRGLVYGKNEKKMGMRGSINSELFFEDIAIPAENIIGQEGSGFAYMMEALDRSRLFAASQAVGLAQGAIDESLDYAGKRVQFGSPITSLQAIQFMMADMVAMTEAARLLTYEAARHIDADDKSMITKACAIAKFIASDNAMKVTTDAVQIMGGYGYMRDFPVERMMRDAKLIQIYTGTNQIMRLVAAREILRSQR
ncbi:MAG: acyl-CoA dehydrogenase [Desulfobacteraceae bacterium]|jgi:alkylation response protein AidB-like acyl-CoA dehydrogenase|nr:MAG: acyl-CoA dehydrogenase [Desulfobacteraceae bacterium]